MTDILIPGTRQTPAVDFRFSAHRLSLVGEAYPENAAAFFGPLLDALSAYLARDGGDLWATLDLRYMNSASTKMIFRLAGLLDDAAGRGRRVVFDFVVHEDDDVLRELGEEIQSDYGWLEFRFRHPEGA